MKVIPCPLCGYDAPGPGCAHCGLAPAETSLARLRSGPVTGILDGLQAVPRGLYYLFTTRGMKRWLLPPMLLTLIAFVATAWGLHHVVDRAVQSVMPGEVELGPLNWEWLQGLSDRWDWAKSTWAWLAGALQWVVDFIVGLLPGTLARTVVWLAITVLAGWYLFSIAYEALAGPFLDEMQARLEERWFGADPRKRIARPTDLPAAICTRRSLQWGGVSAALVLVAALVPGIPFWFGLLLAPLPAGFVVRLDPEYGKWLGWVIRIETRALWVGIQASLVTGFLMLVSLPVYFVLPPLGPAVFAAIVGFATAVSLLDIAFERREWLLRDRLRFVGRNLPAMIAFGMTSGLMLAVPVLGWMLMVPAASIGGLWLLCRLDKSGLRPAERGLPPRR